MTIERGDAQDAIGAAVIMRPAVAEELHASGRYEFECLAPDGSIRWHETIDNLVVTVGKNNLLDNYFAGSAYTAAFFLGLVDGGSAPTFAAGDTMASHAGWTENTTYSNATRPAPTFNAASAGSKSTTATSFNINGTATVAGGFLTTNSTVGGTTGTLYSAGAFTGGNRSVVSGDTLNITYTASV